jgi:colanic acid/amylovoran biosynthesis glycosyltransferase
MRVAYVLNTYPAVSHAFIRREIRALEELGVIVQRIALRGWDAPIVDTRDEEERGRTNYVLERGMAALAGTVLGALVRNPMRLARAARKAWSMARYSQRGLPYHLAYLAEACRVVELARMERADHLHAHFGTNAAEVVMLARILGGPLYSFTVHGPEEFDGPVGLHLREKIEHSAFVVAISSFGRSQLFRWLPQAAWSKVKVVHCGVDEEFRSGASTPPSSKPRLVCVGRLCEQKGQLLLVQAAASLAAEGHAFELILAGDGDMRPALEAFILARGLLEHVRITGWLTSAQVREEMLASRAVVLPSFAEGLPVVLMEAMALGRPVLTTLVAGIPELVQHGKHGWLVPAGNVEALEDALRQVLDASEESLVRMGADAREKVLMRHGADEGARRLLSLMKQVHT